MSATSPTSVRLALPPAIRGLLRQVRFRIRRDSLLSGVLFSISCAIAVFWGTLGLETGWFLLQYLELPPGLRVILLLVMVSGAVWLGVRRGIVPLVRRIRDAYVALMIERRFPEFQDRLVTTVESTRGLPLEGPL